MVEQANAGERHDKTVLVAAVNDNVVTNRAAGLDDIGNAAAPCALDVVVEREERVRAERNVVEL